LPRYALTIAYDGTDFSGWQKQEPYAPDPAAEDDGSGPDLLPVREGESRQRVALRTVQHVAERAVREVVREPVILMGASRTDAGVHARGQCAAFTCTETAWPVERGLDRLLRAVNGKLPEDVLVVGARRAGPAFDPIHDAVAKEYTYTLHAARERALWDRRFVHHVYEPIDVAAMNAAAAHIVGEHDFVSFAAAGHGRLTTVRTVLACGVETPAPDRVVIRVAGTGFLYNMVRIIAGTLVDVGRGRIAADGIPGIIASKDRRSAGPTLPPTGLCLEWIRYAGEVEA